MKTLVREITDLRFTLSGVNRATVTAVGNVPTTGWTNPALVDSGQANNGIRFDFVWEAPSGLAGQMITAVTANTTDLPEGQEIVVRSETNEKTLQLPNSGD